MLNQVAMVVPSRVLVRAASTLSKEATRIEVRKQKRANCAVYGFGLSASGEHGFFSRILELKCYFVLS